MKRKAILLSLIVILSLLAYYLHTSRGSHSPAASVAPAPAAAPVPAPAPPPKQQKSKTVPTDYSWAQLSKDELEEWAALFHHQKKPTTFGMKDVIVHSGEAIVADVYEATPGEYVFTKVTPTISHNDQGTEIVSVAIDSFGITTDGALHERVNHTTHVKPGDIHHIGQTAKEGSYSVEVQPYIEAGAQVRITIQGGYQKFMPATPTTSEDQK